MTLPIKSVIIEGVDRLGKNTLITGIQDRLGFFQEIHYKKPEQLDLYVNEGRVVYAVPDDVITERVIEFANKRYQMQSFTTMLQLLTSGERLIMNRSHIGEAVYAPRYRKYDGSYVFDLEQAFIERGSQFHKSTLLVLLHTSSFNFITDDGLSFDFSQKEEEQNDFTRAFERSAIVHKVMIDVHNGDRGFVSTDKILDTVITAMTDLPQMRHQNWYVSWHRDETGQIVRDNYLAPDPKKIIT